MADYNPMIRHMREQHDERAALIKATTLERPTFDEWFKARNGGSSFEELHQRRCDRIDASMKLLSQLMREYVSEMVGA